MRNTRGVSIAAGDAGDRAAALEGAARGNGDGARTSRLFTPQVGTCVGQNRTQCYPGVGVTPVTAFSGADGKATDRDPSARQHVGPEGLAGAPGRAADRKREEAGPREEQEA